MRTYSREDKGATHVLEAVIIATIMLSAVAYVTTFEQPPAATTPGRELLRQKADDALAILHDTPVSDSPYGDNLLSVLLAHCMQGNCTGLSQKLGKLLPVGSSYALYVSNGYSTFPVYIEREPTGEAVTARQLFEPRWSYTFTEQSLLHVNNETDALVVYALPVYNSNVVGPGGSPLKVTVKGTKRSDGSNYTLEASASTLALAASDAGLYPAVSLNFLTNRTGNRAHDLLDDFYPGGVWNLVGESVSTITGWPTNKSIKFRMQLTESAGVPLAVGTELVVDVPRGWNASGWGNADWAILKDATDRNGTANSSSVVARLLRPVQGETIEFHFNATYHGDTYTYYPFHAKLTRGADAEASLLVIGDSWPDNTQTHAVPHVLMSVPRPMGATARTTWSLVVDVPYHPSGSFVVSKHGVGSWNFHGVDPGQPLGAADENNAITFTEIVIEEQNGAPIFGGVFEHDKIKEGIWTNYQNKLVWRGHHNSTYGPLNLTFDVVASGKPGAQMGKPSLLPPITFDEWTGRLVQQVSPGLYRAAYLPDNSTAAGYAGEPSMPRFQGYTTALGPLDTPLQHGYTLPVVHRNAELDGNGTYVVHPFSPFQDSLWGSYIRVKERSVPIGGTAVMTADVQSLLFALSQAGQQAGVTVTLYPPWSGNSKIPIWTQPNLESSILQSDITQVAMIDMDNDGYKDAVMGTSTGRVFAVNALTGERIQGNVWIAPILSGGASVVAQILQLEPIVLGGQEYIVVGTDEKSGVYVLDKEFKTKWSWDKSSRDSIALDTTVDFDGDGRRDVAVAVTGGLVYVLRAIDGISTLQYLPANPPLTSVPEAFMLQQGTPTGLLASPLFGKDTDPGLAVSFTALPGSATEFRINPDNPLHSQTPQLYVKTPRAGLNASDENGQALWTFLGAPITKTLAVDQNGDGTDEVLAGSSAGYVFMLDSKKAGSPVGSVVWVPITKIVDGDGISELDTVWLTTDGEIGWSFDGWTTHSCVSCEPGTATAAKFPMLNAVALNGTGSVWAVGDFSFIMRATDSSFAGAPWMSWVFPVNATKQGLGYDFVTAPAHFYDVAFGHGPRADHGIAVGRPVFVVCGLPEPLGSTCDESVVLRTQNGGQNWTLANQVEGTLLGLGGARVTANLTRINFTTEDVGWILGETGTLLRTTDKGVHWQGITPPVAFDLKDISCVRTDPNRCFVVTADYLYRTTNALADPLLVQWENLTTRMGAYADRELLSIGTVDDKIAYLGSINRLLQTFDGGDSWTTLPLTYITSDVTRILSFPDGRGLILGGNATHARQLHPQDYEGSSTIYTTNTMAGELNGDAWSVTAKVALAQSAYAKAQVYLSADGVTWKPGKPSGSGVHQEVVNGVTVTFPTLNYTAIMSPSEVGRDVRVRLDFKTEPDVPFQTARVRWLKVEATTNVTGPAQVNHSRVIDLASHDHFDAAASTGVWDKHLKEIRSPLAQKMWTRNVSGEVLDIVVGKHVSGTSEKEIWVSTGDVIADNSPDYQIYAADPDTILHKDNRIYLLDGSNGTVLKTSQQMAGKVTDLTLADRNDDGVDDILFATVFGGTLQSWLFAFDPITLEILPHPTSSGSQWLVTLKGEPTDAEPARTLNDASVVVATRSYVEQGSVKPGTAHHYSAALAKLWGMTGSDRGYYTVTADIPRDWFFGPYVTEVRVDWTDTVTVDEGGIPVQKEVLQSAKYFDYFLVTPPDALSPPSPIYDAHLVAWFDDWR